MPVSKHVWELHFNRSTCFLFFPHHLLSLLWFRSLFCPEYSQFLPLVFHLCFLESQTVCNFLHFIDLFYYFYLLFLCRRVRSTTHPRNAFLTGYQQGFDNVSYLFFVSYLLVSPHYLNTLANYFNIPNCKSTNLVLLIISPLSVLALVISDLIYRFYLSCMYIELATLVFH